MKTLTLFSLLFIFLAVSSTAFAQEDALIGMLTNELNINNDQAMGGAGALFNYAKESLSSEDFEKVSRAVPDVSGYLDAIPALGDEKSTSMLGKATQTLVGMPAVTAAFEKLGLSQDMVGLFTPLLVKYVDEKGGKAVGDLLRGVFSNKS
jgi:hypothetical protein